MNKQLKAKTKTKTKNKNKKEKKKKDFPHKFFAYGIQYIIYFFFMSRLNHQPQAPLNLQPMCPPRLASRKYNIGYQ